MRLHRIGSTVDGYDLNELFDFWGYSSPIRLYFHTLFLNWIAQKIDEATFWETRGRKMKLVLFLEVRGLKP